MFTNLLHCGLITSYSGLICNVGFISGEETGVVATAGGSCVCLIDCNTGRVMRRYKEEGRVCSRLVLKPIV